MLHRFIHSFIYSFRAKVFYNYRMAALVWRCLLGLAPAYLVELFGPTQSAGAPSPTIQLIKVFSVYHLHAPPPGRNVPLQWLAPQFGRYPLNSARTFRRPSFQRTQLGAANKRFFS